MIVGVSLMMIVKGPCLIDIGPNSFLFSASRRRAHKYNYIREFVLRKTFSTFKLNSYLL